MTSKVLSELTHQRKKYAGIGSRKTPPKAIRLMVLAGEIFAKEGLILRSGGADGADSAFEEGCDEAKGSKEIFLPWKGFNNKSSLLFQPSQEAQEIASKIHPNWNACSNAARLLHSRNAHQILGENLKAPCAFVLFWAPENNGEVRGGTATAVNLARKHDIPCFNLSEEKTFCEWEEFLYGKL